MKKSIVGTSLQGYIEVSFQKLVETFGQPSTGDGEKIDAEWVIETPAGIATIYNYKDGISYLGATGTPVDRIKFWHIGGRNKAVVAHVYKSLNMTQPKAEQR